MNLLSLLEQRARWIAFSIVFLFVFFYLRRQVSWTIDDAFITFRYAQNVVDGYGPVYNVGEQVEGYTCFSWMALLAVAGAFGFPPLLAAKIAGMLFVFGTTALVGFWDRKDRSYSRTQSIVAMTLTGTTAAFVQWGASGMETSMFCFAAVACVYTYLGLLDKPELSTSVLLGLLGSLLVMTRPNGIVLLAAILVHAISNRRLVPPRAIRVMVGTFVGVYGAYFAWRYSYYGYLLPNTFYAKVGGSGAQINRGVRYVVAAMPAFGFLVMPIVGAWGKKTSSSRGDRLLLSFVVVHLVYSIAVGGDNFPAHRFLVVLVPFFALLATRGLYALAESNHRRALLVAVVVGYNFVAGGFDPETRLRVRRDYVAGHGTIVGHWLKWNVPEDAVVATNSAGALAFYSERVIVDMLGLNDAEIAHTPVERMGAGKAGHERGNGFYVLSRKPDYVFFGPPKGSADPMFRGDEELFKLPTFRRRYVYERVKLNEEFTISFYRRQSDEELEEKRLAKEKREAEEARKKKKKERKKKKKKGKVGHPKIAPVDEK